MNALLHTALQPALTLASGLPGKRKLFILIYHRVLDKPDFMRPWELDKAGFLWQMELLSKHFTVLSLADGIAHLKANTLPPRAVAITFDDGYADNYLTALPILQKFQLPATFFIASGYLNGGRMWNDSIIEVIRNLHTDKLDLTELGLGIWELREPAQKAQVAVEIIKQVKHLPPDERQSRVDYLLNHYGRNVPNDLMMTTEQLQALHKSGMEIGGHTVSHPIIAKLDQAQLHQEIIENKQTLENLLNTRLRFFAYPNGKPGQDYLPEQVPVIKELGYEAALSTQWGVAHHGSDLYQLPRFTPWDNHPLKFMLRMIRLYLQPN